MTEQELEAAFNRLGFNISPHELKEIAAATQFIDQMVHLVKKPRSVMNEPAHLVSFKD